MDVNLTFLSAVKNLLRYWPILGRSTTLHFAGDVNTGQKSPCISIIWSLLSFQTGSVEVQGHLSAL